MSGFRPRLGLDWTAPVQEGSGLCGVAGPFDRDKVDISSLDNVGNSIMWVSHIFENHF